MNAMLPLRATTVHFQLSILNPKNPRNEDGWVGRVNKPQTQKTPTPISNADAGPYCSQVLAGRPPPIHWRRPRLWPVAPVPRERDQPLREPAQRRRHGQERPRRGHACDDVMKLQIQVDEHGTIVDSKFKTFGCGSAIASSSVATEWLKGKSVEECLKIKNTDIASHLKLSPVKLHCSMLAEDAIKAAISDYKRKQAASN
ncbi:iron-binding protein [Phytophthora pseudosyringae]|uniref:Iron-binding protein n=1 Tax=Phytophthora pseudosyringae TaxID=221518 RepID=A0A8T1W686_9STRA|nr:iron-binding protein [Phytophthora pseudosyringae]